jgi:hypothetical protein
MEAEDARHDTMYVNPEFKMPVVSEPPSQPATPPSREAIDREAYQAKKAEREQQRVNTEAADRRAKALELACSLYAVPASERLLLPVNVFALADECLRYIETGERPA